MTKKILKWGLAIISSLFLLLIAAVYFLNFHPAPAQAEKVECQTIAPILKPGQKLKILSWNVQFMAGKNYVFYYDLLDGSGPDDMPSELDTLATIKEVARVIKDENPDIILLQEVDQGAKRTYYQDQLAMLLNLLPNDYKCNVSAYYWKSDFVPHPRILGAVGMKLVVISKYKIDSAIRHQLALMPSDPVTREFNLKRAILETHLPMENAKDFVVMTTHFEAFAQGTDTLTKQTEQTGELLDNLTANGYSWALGGDFNLLAPGKQYYQLNNLQRQYFKEKTELEPFFLKYNSVPSLAEINGPDGDRWITHFPNDPDVKKPDRTIDYIFMSKNLQPDNHYVRQTDTLKISDHFPMITELSLPK
ncbi:MAG: endonuclease/exonuclease/phosphatase family protein [Patescibacteria group bacterium]